MSLQLAIGLALGIVSGVFSCRGLGGASRTMSWLVRVARAALPKFNLRELGAGSICVVVPIAVAATAALQASRVAPSHLGLKPQAVAVMFLVCGFTHELGLLCHLLSCEEARKACFGAQRGILLGLKSFPRKEDILASAGMVTVYAIVLATYLLMYTFDIAWCHQDPVRLRPVSTLRYFEWTTVVPILLFISGRLHLNNPLHVVLPPIFQTVAYIWLSWAAQLCQSTLLRALLVSACFTAVTESFLGMWKWAKASHKRESLLLLFTNIAFVMYGIVYLLSLADVITPLAEEALYTVGDVTVKLTFTGVMSSYARRRQLDCFYSTVKVNLDLMTGLRALVGSQFDLLINCKIAACGLLLTDTNHTLEQYTGRSLAGRHLEDICVRDADRTRLRQLSFRGDERPGLGQHVGPRQRQEATYRMPDLICIDMLSAMSPTGAVSAELFVAVPAIAGDIGDDVLIGIRIGDDSGNFVSERPAIGKPSTLILGDWGGSESGQDLDSESDITEITEVLPSQPVGVPPVAQVRQQAEAPHRRLVAVAEQPSSSIDATKQFAAPEPGRVQVSQAHALRNSTEALHQNSRVVTDSQVAAAEITLSKLRDVAKEAKTWRESKQASLQQMRSEALKEIQVAAEAAAKAAKAVTSKQKELHEVKAMQEQASQPELPATDVAQHTPIDMQCVIRAPTATDLQLAASDEEQQREMSPQSQAQDSLKECNRPASVRSVRSSYSQRSAMLPPVEEMDTPSASDGTSDPSSFSQT